MPYADKNKLKQYKSNWYLFNKERINRERKEKYYETRELKEETKLCVECGKLYKAIGKKNNSKTCSKVCSYRRHKRNHLKTGYPSGVVGSILHYFNCKECGKLNTSKVPFQKYCDQQCRKSFYKERLYDNYLRSAFVSKSQLTEKDVPQKILEVYRKSIKLKRLLNKPIVK